MTHLPSADNGGNAALAPARLAVIWLPVALWVALIVILATDLFAAAHTGALLRRVLTALFGPIAPDTFRLIHIAVRKSGHFAGYAVLGWLSFRAWRATRPRGAAKGWALAALALSLAVALSDEGIQSAMPDRSGSGWDVLLDLSGAAFALLLLWMWVRRGARPS